MCDRRVRVLVLAGETALADVIYRGLTAVPDLETEIEVVLDESTVQGLLELRRYDLLVVGSSNGTDLSALAEPLDTGIPVVAVGGSPRDARALRGGVAETGHLARRLHPHDGAAAQDRRPGARGADS